MTIAQEDRNPPERSEGLTSGGALPFSGLLRHIQAEPDGAWEILKLSNAAQRAQWAASVYVCLRNIDRTSELSKGKVIRERVLTALRYLARRGSVTHPVSKALWNKLYVLTTMCAHEPDWSSAAGPLMGASNKTLEDSWGVSNARRSLRDLAQWGFVIPFCPKGNGHRSYKKTKDGPVGAGWSLAPLRLLVDALEVIAGREEQLRQLRLEVPDRIKSAIGATRALVNPFRDTHEWAAAATFQLEALCKHRDRANRGSIEALEHRAGRRNRRGFMELENVIHLCSEVEHGASIFERPAGPDLGACIAGAFLQGCSPEVWRQSELRDQADATCCEDRIGDAAASGAPVRGGQAGAIPGSVDPLG